jgi:hypothetical protein
VARPGGASSHRTWWRDLVAQVLIGLGDESFHVTFFFFLILERVLRTWWRDLVARPDLVAQILIGLGDESSHVTFFF